MELIQASVEPETVKELKAIANTNGLSFSSLVRVFLVEKIREMKQSNPVGQNKVSIVPAATAQTAHKRSSGATYD